MRCQHARRLLPVLDQGGLSPRRGEALADHLETCGACQRLKTEHEGTLHLLSAYEAPGLPQGFGEQLRARLELEVSRPQMKDTHPLPALEEEPGRRQTLRTLAYLAAGLLVGALSTWGIQRATDEGPGRAGDAPRPARAVPEPATLQLGQVAVVTLALEAQTDHPDAELEVVLPDGLSLVGEGLADLEEKVLRWAEPLRPGINLIRVPVRALRAGNWLLVARARTDGHELGAQSRLKVTES